MPKFGEHESVLPIPFQPAYPYLTETRTEPTAILERGVVALEGILDLLQAAGKRRESGFTDESLLDVPPIAKSLSRIADHVDPPPSNIVDTNYVAQKLALSVMYISQMASSGTIPRNCIVPGTGEGKRWKFYRHHIDHWIENR